MKQISILQPQLLQIIDNDISQYGANQIWYPTNWQQRAGCGPTVCSHLIWYLSQTRDDCKLLCNYNGTHKAGFLSLMEAIWQYVTPSKKGVNTSSIFIKGALKYAQEQQLSLTSMALEVPNFIKPRPSFEQITQFLYSALEQDLPIAFLNLSNGRLTNLDSWHWVTLISLSDSGAIMYDQGKQVTIDLKKWLKTTALGGSFVILYPSSN